MNEFQRGGPSTRDDPRSRRPLEISTPEIIEKAHDMILNDRQVRVQENF